MAAGAPVAVVGQLRVILQSPPRQQHPGNDESNHHSQNNRCSTSSTHGGWVVMRRVTGWHGWHGCGGSKEARGEADRQQEKH
jgi:hypothetical protein